MPRAVNALSRLVFALLSAMLAAGAARLAGAAPPPAIPYVYPFNAMNGQEVVEHRLKQPASQLDYVNREKVEAYLNGIRDGAHGVTWCLSRPLLPHELNLALVQHLKRTRTPAELKGNAAPLVLAELGRRFPCDKPRKQRIRGR